MTFRIPTARLPNLPARGRRLLPILVGLVVLIILISVYVQIETDYLWFQSVHFTSVFSRRLVTKIVLFFVFGGVMALIVGANMVIAYRLRPPFRPSSPEQQQLEQLAGALRPLRVWLKAPPSRRRSRTSPRCRGGPTHRRLPPCTRGQRRVRAWSATCASSPRRDRRRRI